MNNSQKIDAAKRSLRSSLFWTMAFQDMERRRIGQIIIVDINPLIQKVETANMLPSVYYDRMVELELKQGNGLRAAFDRALYNFVAKDKTNKATVCLLHLDNIDLSLERYLQAVIVLSPSQEMFVKIMVNCCSQLMKPADK